MNLHSRISIIIPTRNRLDDLLETLEQITCDTHPNVEILVYDDASDIDPQPVIARRFPNVRILRTAARVGPCWLRNRMIEAATGELIIGFDDDCAFATIDAFTQIESIFATRPRLGLLSCRVRTPDRGLWPANRGAPMRETSTFIACGFAARREALRAVGGFDPAIFRAGEERDLAIRLLDAGYEIRHTDDILAEHRESTADRDHQFIHGHAFRNELLFICRRLPGCAVPWQLLHCFASHTRFCFRRGWARAWRTGLVGFVMRLPHVFVTRRPVRKSTWQRYRDGLIEPSPVDARGGIPFVLQESQG